MTAMGTLGLIAIGLTVVLIALGQRGRLLTAAALVSGFALVEFLRPWVGTALAALEGRLGGIGTVAAAAIVAWVAFELLKGGTRAATPYLALLFAVVCVSAGGPFPSIAEGVSALIGEVDAVTTAM